MLQSMWYQTSLDNCCLIHELNNSSKGCLLIRDAAFLITIT